MQLTNKQEQGLKIAVANYNLGLPYTVIAGYAGSGKSTLVHFIVDALHISPKDIAYVAYTGKAANVLRQKGCPNAVTAHKLIYYSVPLPNGKYMYEPKKTLDHKYKLIVVDEVSMLPKYMWDLLLTYRVHVLAIGDPGQLPPIGKDEEGREINNHVLEHPHIFLDEIMRQAQDSAIIRLSMHIREGKDFVNFQNVSGEVRIIPSIKRMDPDDLNACILGADQILTATNTQRMNINNQARTLFGFGPEPEKDDKIIALSNHWDFTSQNQVPLTNGAIGNIESLRHYDAHYPSRLDLPNVDLLMVNMKIPEEEDMYLSIPIDYKFLKTNEPALTPKQLYKLRQYTSRAIRSNMVDFIPYDFTYGYAITTWKAQGSEWSKILGFDGKWVLHKNGKEEYIKYLYTLVTRASDTVILIGD